MILSSIVSFFGGGVFRMIWGEVSNWMTKKQDHEHELARMKFQAEVDAAQHERNMTSIRVQADLGVKTIQVQAQSAIGQLETEGWLAAVKATTIQTGIKWVDAWNAMIRPGVATWAIAMMTLGEFSYIILSEDTLQIAGAALGIYIADRTLFRRGK